MHNRVILLETTQGNIDVSRAARYGELTYLFERGDERCSVFNTDRYEQLLRSRLAGLKFDPTRDYVCVAGKIVCIAVLCSVIAAEYGPFCMLMFDAHECEYVKRQLGLGFTKGDSNVVVTNNAATIRSVDETAC